MENSKKKQKFDSLWDEVVELLSAHFEGEALDLEKEDLRGALIEIKTIDGKIDYLEKIIAQLKKSYEEPKKPSKGLTKIIAAFLTVVVIFGLIVASVIFFGRRNNDKKQVRQKLQTTQTSQQAEVKDSIIEPFEILPYEENPGGKMIAGPLDENALTGDFEKDLAIMLYEAEHHPETLKGYAKSFGLNTNLKEWATEKGSKKFLSTEAQELFFELKATMLTFKWTHLENVGITGYSTGIVDGEFAQNTIARDYTGWSGWKIEKDNVYIILLDWCGNGTHPNQFKDIPKKDIPIPSKPPVSNPFKDIPKKDIPKKDIPIPSKPPVSNPKLDPKKPSQEPAMQNNAPTGGDRNISDTVSEPADNTAPSFPSTYQAPTPPSSSRQAPAQNNGGNTTPETGISNAPSGSFTDSNGTTKVDSDGSVTTPNGSFDGLIGNSAVPPVENKNSSNSGVNNGFADPNTIPMDD